MYRLLIADDEETIRNGLKKMITSFDLDFSSIETAEDGETALKMVQQFKPEIILMDINMPYMDGLSVIKEIRKIDNEVKIIIVSGYDDFSYAQKALSLEVFSYLLKPIQINDLLKTLQDAINSYTERLLELNQLSKQTLNTHQSIGNQVIDFIKEHITNNKLSLEYIANELNISNSYIIKIIKNKTNMNFTDYVNQLRINLAIQLLLNDNIDYSIQEISEKVGYNSQHYFSRAFKKYTGLSPLQYKTKNLDSKLI